MSRAGAVFVWWTVTFTSLMVAALTDEQYYNMPRLFYMDNYEECMSKHEIFCIGTFDLLPGTNHNLFRLLREYSADKLHFNHTRIHRGLCVDTSCADFDHFHLNLEDRFENCVDKWATDWYGLRAKLTAIHHCRAEDTSTWILLETNMVFGYAVMMLIAANVFGTAYHAFRNIEEKPNKYVIACSLIANWQRLVTCHDDGDGRLAALHPIHGMKSLTLLLVLLAHTVFGYHLTFVFNPEFLEKNGHHPLSAFLQNGSVIVQTFIMLTSFLLAYNILLRVDAKDEVNLRMLPLYLLHRICRICPVYLVVVGAVSTVRGGGPLWWLLAEEGARCRRNWWTNALFINNFVGVDDRCLIQTWFLAVDMQLYVVATLLTMILIRRRHAALRMLSGLLLVSIMVNFITAYHWNLEPMLMMMQPESMRVQYLGSQSFVWSYSSPWGNLPATLLGLMLAFHYHRQQTTNFKVEGNVWILWLYRCSVPGMIAWVWAGRGLRAAPGRSATALYAALDRPVFVAFTAVATYGFLYKIDNVWWRVVSWRGWRVLGRLSLSVLLVHWSVTLAVLASEPRPVYASVLDIGGKWLVTVTLSYSIAMVLTLLVVFPAQRFLQIILLRND